MSAKCPICDETIILDDNLGTSCECKKCGIKINNEVAELYGKIGLLQYKDDANNVTVVKDYFKTAIYIENESSDNKEVRRAVLFNLSVNYSKYLLYILKANESAEEVLDLLRKFDGIEFENNPYVSMDICTSCVELLLNALSVLGRKEEYNTENDRLVKILELSTADNDKASPIDELEKLLIQCELDIQKQKFDSVQSKLDEATTIVNDRLDNYNMDDSVRESFVLYLLLTKARYISAQYIFNGNINDQDMEKNCSILEDILISIKQLILEGVMPDASYVDAEELLGASLLAAGHLIKGNKHMKSAKKLKKLIEKGERIF